MVTPIERKGFRKSWVTLLIFLAVVNIPTLVNLIDFQNEIQASLISLGANILLAVIAGLLLWWEGVHVRDIGMGGRAWKIGLVLFVGWFILTTVIDLAGGWIASLFEVTLEPFESYEWSLATILRWIARWIGVGIAEELAFRGYLHNKLVKVLDRRWLGISLAALLFGLWHIPGGLYGGSALMDLLPVVIFFSVFALVFIHLPYEWTGLLPFLAFYHGWSDFPILATLQSPNIVGVIGGYLLGPIILWVYKKAYLDKQPAMIKERKDLRITQPQG